MTTAVEKVAKELKCRFEGVQEMLGVNLLYFTILDGGAAHGTTISFRSETLTVSVFVQKIRNKHLQFAAA